MNALSDHGSAALSRLLELRPAAVVATHRRLGDATAVVEAADLVAVMTLLRDDTETAFEMLTDLTAVDWLGREPRFELVYHLFSVERCHRLRVKAFASGEPPGVASLTAVWPSANWMEREVFDLYGVRFDGHPDLRRLLLYDEFEGHPLRKDYPKRGRQPLVGPSN